MIERGKPYAAEFIDTATDPADDLRVVIREWDEGEHSFGPVRWSPIGNALPQAGDECTVVERSDGRWTVVAWWSDSQDTGVAQGAVDALEDRVEALEDSVEALEASSRGKVTVTWPGGSTISNTVTAAHGLGVTPAEVLATINSQVGSGFCWVEASANGTNVSVRLATTGTPANTATTVVSWSAYA